MILYITKDEKTDAVKIHDQLPARHMNAKTFKSFWGNENTVSYMSSVAWIFPVIPHGACWQIGITYENDSTWINILDQNVTPKLEAF